MVSAARKAPKVRRDRQVSWVRRVPWAKRARWVSRVHKVVWVHQAKGGPEESRVELARLGWKAPKATWELWVMLVLLALLDHRYVKVSKESLHVQKETLAHAIGLHKCVNMSKESLNKQKHPNEAGYP